MERSIGAGPVGAAVEQQTSEVPVPAEAGTAAAPEPVPSAEPVASEAGTEAEPVQSAEPEPSQAVAAAAPADGGMDEMATGTDPGSTLIVEPLETAPQLDATDWALLAGSILAGLAGVWLILRYRPAPGKPKAA